VDFQETHGKPNQPLIDETIENNRLRQLLAESDARLATIKAKGDSVQRLRDAIGRAENRLQSLLSKAETEEIARLVAEHYGWNIPWKRENASETKRGTATFAVAGYFSFNEPSALDLWTAPGSPTPSASHGMKSVFLV
jgi:hypothetical protein